MRVDIGMLNDAIVTSKIIRFKPYNFHCKKHAVTSSKTIVFCKMLLYYWSVFGISACSDIHLGLKLIFILDGRHLYYQGRKDKPYIKLKRILVLKSLCSFKISFTIWQTFFLFLTLLKTYTIKWLIYRKYYRKMYATLKIYL